MSDIITGNIQDWQKKAPLHKKHKSDLCNWLPQTVATVGAQMVLKFPGNWTDSWSRKFIKGFWQWLLSDTSIFLGSNNKRRLLLSCPFLWASWKKENAGNRVLVLYRNLALPKPTQGIWRNRGFCLFLQVYSGARTVEGETSSNQDLLIGGTLPGELSPFYNTVLQVPGKILFSFSPFIKCFTTILTGFFKNSKLLWQIMPYVLLSQSCLLWVEDLASHSLAASFQCKQLNYIQLK